MPSLCWHWQRSSRPPPLPGDRRLCHTPPHSPLLPARPDCLAQALAQVLLLPQGELLHRERDGLTAAVPALERHLAEVRVPLQQPLEIPLRVLDVVLG